MNDLLQIMIPATLPPRATAEGEAAELFLHLLSAAVPRRRTVRLCRVAAPRRQGVLAHVATTTSSPGRWSTQTTSPTVMRTPCLGKSFLR